MSPVAPLAITWLGAVIVAMLDARRRSVQWLAVAMLGAALVAHIIVAREVLSGGTLETHAGDWPEGVGIVLRVDALGAVFAVLTAAVLLVCLLYEVLGGLDARALPAIVLFLATG